MVYQYIYKAPAALYGNELRKIPEFFPYIFSPIDFKVRHAGEPILMALDISTNLDFGEPS